MKRALLLIALTILPAAAQAQGSFGRFHALIIGNQNYQQLTKLETPIADAKAVAEVLNKQYGFTVDLLLDADRDKILKAISQLRSRMTNKDDNLLIYYAGHGFLDEESGVDYWQPVDAEKDNDVYWVPTSRVTDLLRVIKARHVLIVADSCYSGSLLMRDSGARLAFGMSQDEWLKRMQEKRSRTALTSGGEEPVADGGGSGHSVFAKVFLEVLRENKGILDGNSLFDRIKRPVVLHVDQTPYYGDIKKADSSIEIERGDFLLVPKQLHGGTLPQQTTEVDLSYLQRGGETIGRYIDHGDGTVTDTKSGLMWKRCSEGLSGADCEKGKIVKYTWNDAMQRFKNVAYAGHADWRLPTIDELKTLVQCSKGKDKNGNCKEGSEIPTINQQAFPNAEAGWFVWSGSPRANDSVSAWYVLFKYGFSDYDLRDYGSAVRLVRGGQ